MNETLLNQKAIFHTGTKIDPISWEMMGISAKETEESIGLFGTGLKYAISVLLRTGHKFTIYSEGEKYVFDKEPMEFRGKAFEKIVCNGTPLPFTTEYGKLWAIEEAYRELVSNTMDENGIWMLGESHIDGGTSIVVEGKQIVECMKNHSEYFVGDREPIEKTATVTIYQGKGTIFYRGVKVGFEPNSMYSYEFNRYLDLTEDRTIKYAHESKARIGRAVVKEIKNKEILHKMAISTKGSFESTFDYNWDWSNQFMEVVKEIWDKTPQKLNPSIRGIFKKKRPEHQWEYLELDENQMLLIEKAKEIISKFGYVITAPIVLVNNEDSNTLAFVHENQIHLTERSLDKGLFNFVTILLEEHFHIIGYYDESRAFQTYLLEELVKNSAKLHKIIL